MVDQELDELDRAPQLDSSCTYYKLQNGQLSLLYACIYLLARNKPSFALLRHFSSSK